MICCISTQNVCTDSNGNQEYFKMELSKNQTVIVGKLFAIYMTLFFVSFVQFTKRMRLHYRLAKVACRFSHPNIAYYTAVFWCSVLQISAVVYSDAVGVNYMILFAVLFPLNIVFESL